MHRTYRLDAKTAPAPPRVSPPAAMPFPQRPSAARRGRKWKKTALAVLLGGGMVAFFALGGSEWASVEAIHAHRGELLAYISQHYGWTALLATLVYATAAILSLPLGIVLSIAMGFLFGRWVGTAVVIVGGTTGSVAAFAAARYLFADEVRERMGPRITRLARGFQEDAFSYMLFTRMVPFFPFWFINLVPAFTPVPTRTFAAATVIGITPASFVFANLGESLGRLSAPREVLRAGPLVALSLLGALALVPVLWKKLRTRKTGPT